MKVLLRVSNPDEIESVVERVHDCWLDADSVTFSAEEAIVRIRYLKDIEPRSPFVGRVRFPAAEYYLKISKVTSLSIKDTEKIQFYDINTINYDPASMFLEIKTGIPIGIRAFVSGLDIAIEETGNVVSR